MHGHRPAQGRPGQLVAHGLAPVSAARYLEIVEVGERRFLLFYEAPLKDGSHELRSEVVDLTAVHP